MTKNHLDFFPINTIKDRKACKRQKKSIWSTYNYKQKPNYETEYVAMPGLVVEHPTYPYVNCHAAVQVQRD